MHANICWSIHAGNMCKEIHLWFGGWMICGDADLLLLLLANVCS
jgi:hypothetical protein